MTLPRAITVRFARAVLVCVALVTTLVVAPSVARADNVAALIDSLKNDGSDKVRLSAALNLAQLGDAKAILPMAGALLNDSDKDVRAACAAGLGKLVTASTKASIKSLVVKNLKQAASDDASDIVKSQAAKALKTITGESASTGTGGSGGSGGGKGGIYVNLGPMSSKTGGANDAKLKALMAKVAASTMAKSATHMMTSWPGGGTPTQQVITSKGVAAFYVDGTLNTLSVKSSGGGATISCKVSMLLAEFPSKNMFGFLNGGASVTAGSSQRDQDQAGEDCIEAVIENLIANKIVPTICSKVGGGSCP